MNSTTDVYDPHEHAEQLGLTVAYQSLRANFGMYIPGRKIILLRRGMKVATERSVLAHEIAHYLADDRRTDGVWSIRQERRADLAASRRLIPAERLRQLTMWSSDPREWAIDLQVTGDILLAYINGQKDSA
ncbi:ImmA/IrrE family metallo-endopeptidase [Cryobacterium soli]|uniref:ImmA/IrrE family metallo-endopeptidase n=1 Tax=Cryobacterium soli TaxID=2220095 RepID=UPI000E72E7B6|nr:ImmA/IrrE family metallo-endopeptidase [Cryobacterium soli]